MIVRRERSGDEVVARAVQAAAFATNDDADPAEARPLDALRLDPGWIPALDDLG